MELKLVAADDPILKTKCEDFNFEDPQTWPIELAKDMVKFMYDNNGIGLAANQVGLPYRCFVIKSNPIICCFNPIIVDTSSEQALLDEGCLTLPGVYIKVKRPAIIKVRYTEPNTNIVTKKFIGMTSRVFQHELAHLNGEIFQKNISDTKLLMAIKKAKKLGYNYTLGDFK